MAPTADNAERPLLRGVTGTELLQTIPSAAHLEKIAADAGRFLGELHQNPHLAAKTTQDVLDFTDRLRPPFEGLLHDAFTSMMLLGNFCNAGGSVSFVAPEQAET